MESYTADLFPPEFNASLFTTHDGATLALAKDVYEGLLAGNGIYNKSVYFWQRVIAPPGVPYNETEAFQIHLRNHKAAEQRAELIAGELRTRGFHVDILDWGTSIDMVIK